MFMKLRATFLAASAFVGTMMIATSAWAAPTLFTNAAAFAAANPGLTAYGFPDVTGPGGVGLATAAPTYTLNGVSFVTPIGAYVGNDGGYGSTPYFDAGYPLTVMTTNEVLGLYLGSFSLAQTVSYTYNGETGTLELGPNRALSFLGFSSNGGPLNIAFSNSFELDVTGFLTKTTAVPEPAAWAMFIAGFGLAGAAMRRRPRMTVRFA
jgi:hypothetical protein